MRFALVALIVATPLRGGFQYDFVTTVQTPRYSVRQSGRVVVQGQSYRADLDRRGMRDIDVVISRDGDETAVFIDLEKCSWSYRNRLGQTRSSAYFHLPSDIGDSVDGAALITHRTDGAETIAGFPATKHVIEINYRVKALLSGTWVKGNISARAIIWAVESLPPLPMRRELRTGYAAVDKEIARAAEAVRGMIVRHELEVTRAFEGGDPQTERTVTVIENLRTNELPESLFTIPAEAQYVQRAPGS